MSSWDIKLWNGHGSYLFEVLFRLHPDLNSESVYKMQRDPAQAAAKNYSFPMTLIVGPVKPKM